MAPTKSNLIDLRQISNIADVLTALKELDTRLNSLNMGQFKLFNQAYQVLTNYILQAIEADYFKNPHFIEEFIVSFSSYYFQAVNDAASKEPNLSLPWAKLNQYATHKSAPVFISLLLGANAHINNDLPQVLYKLMQQEKTEELLGDIVKIDKLVMRSGKDIIGLFTEPNKSLNFLKQRFQFTYYRPAMYTILYWRISAWKNYRRLKNDSSAMRDISTRSVKIANHLLYLSNVLA
ncbi:MAG: DUF5995 family protein [Patescibacteria group bacterium]|nr:DUF5995 family protein [Patescibacteria group bacterium]